MGVSTHMGLVRIQETFAIVRPLYIVLVTQRMRLNINQAYNEKATENRHYFNSNALRRKFR